MSEPTFKVEALIERMESFGAALPAIVARVSKSDARWKPTPKDWSILEIVNHLADEEVEDFRMRLDLTLHQPNTPWPPIDPPKAAVDRQYNERELGESVSRFVNERKESVRWLRMLFPPDWTKTYAHPKIGAISAGELLASWAAHDALHLRQLSRRLFDLTQRDAAGFSTRYAGEWNPNG